MNTRSLGAASIFVAALLAMPGLASAEVEQEAAGDFVLTVYRALPAAWVPEQTLAVHATGVVSSSASELQSGALVRLTFPYPGGARAGVLRLDLAAPALGRIYGIGTSEDVDVDYYEVGEGGPDFRADRIDGTVEVVSWLSVPQVTFELRFEDWGPDGVGGTGDDLARELTEGFAIGLVAPSAAPSAAVEPAVSSGGGVEVIWGDPWSPGTASGASSGATSDGGCGSNDSYDGGDSGDSGDSGGCSGDDTGDTSSSDSGGCGGGSDTSDSSDSSDSGCSGDDDGGACDSDAEASPAGAHARRARRVLPRPGNLVAFLLLFAGVHMMRRRAWGRPALRG